MYRATEHFVSTSSVLDEDIKNKGKHEKIVLDRVRVCTNRRSLVSYSLEWKYVVSVALSSNKILNWKNIGFEY